MSQLKNKVLEKTADLTDRLVEQMKHSRVGPWGGRNTVVHENGVKLQIDLKISVLED